MNRESLVGVIRDGSLEVVGLDSVYDLFKGILVLKVVNEGGFQVGVLMVVYGSCHPGEVVDQVLVSLQDLLEGADMQ